MKTILNVLFLSFIFIGNSQTYLHPTVGIAGEYVGSCLETTCSGSYYDNGGAGSNYSNSINNIYRTFCPNTAGNCIRVQFNNFNIEAAGFFGPYDYLTVGNGPTQNSPVFTTPPADGSGRLYGTPATPFSYTSTDPSGCLTFRFFSDGSVSRPGWSATISCVPCASGPSGTDNSDCSFSTQVCSNSSVSGNSTGPGIQSEGCSGTSCPAGGENHTNWYYFQINTGGTFTFNVVPTVATDDYDFTLFGPNVTCGALGSPIRCSDSGLSGTTGLTAAASDFSEDVTGDKFCAPLNVNAGEIYVLMIDEWSTASSGGGYNLNFGGTATLDCTPLPVKLIDFTANYNEMENIVDLYWHTESELNSDFYTVEHSTDGKIFDQIAKVDGAGNTTYETEYITFDTNPRSGTNYYRLVQYDFNGKRSVLKTTSVYVKKNIEHTLILNPNPTNSSTQITFENDKNESVLFVLYDYSGNKVHEEKINTIDGFNSFEFDMSQFNDGIYLISIISSNNLFQSRLIKTSK